jgi:hypothetical protein
MRIHPGVDDDSRSQIGFYRGAQAICSLAGLFWVASLAALVLVYQNVTYTLCSGTILQIPPPSVHWPPQGHNLWYVDLLHRLTLVSVGVTVIGVFLVLYVSPHIDPFRRAGWLIATIVGTLMLAALFWLTGEYHSLRAHIDAIGNCF